jgi:hypothetical protein
MKDSLLLTASVTVARLIESWNLDVLSHQVSNLAADHYMSIAKNHISPDIGSKEIERVNNIRC